MTLQKPTIDTILNRLDRGKPNSTELQHIEELLRQIYHADRTEGILGSDKYKIYVAKAILEDYQGDTELARESIERAIKLRGHLFTFADDFLGHLDSIEQQAKTARASPLQRPDFQKLKEELHGSTHTSNPQQHVPPTGRQERTEQRPSRAALVPSSIADTRADNMLDKHRQKISLQQTHRMPAASNRHTGRDSVIGLIVLILFPILWWVLYHYFRIELIP